MPIKVIRGDWFFKCKFCNDCYDCYEEALACEIECSGSHEQLDSTIVNLSNNSPNPELDNFEDIYFYPGINGNRSDLESDSEYNFGSKSETLDLINLDIKLSKQFDPDRYDLLFASFDANKSKYA
jgi:hypothetical protein